LETTNTGEVSILKAEMCSLAHVGFIKSLILELRDRFHRLLSNHRFYEDAVAGFCSVSLPSVIVNRLLFSDWLFQSHTLLCQVV